MDERQGAMGERLQPEPNSSEVQKQSLTQGRKGCKAQGRSKTKIRVGSGAVRLKT